jgi:hypothetical protein
MKLHQQSSLLMSPLYESFHPLSGSFAGNTQVLSSNLNYYNSQRTADQDLRKMEHAVSLNKKRHLLCEWKKL